MCATTSALLIAGILYTVRKKLLYYTILTKSFAPPKGPKNTIFVPDDLDLWPCLLTFKLIWARGQTRLPCEFGPNPFSDSRYTPCLKKTSHLWLAITLTHMNGFWYVLAEMLPIKAIKRRFTVPRQITCASALPDKTRKHENHIFHSIGLCYTHNAPVRYLPERKKIVICDVFDSVYICWGSKISH